MKAAQGLQQILRRFQKMFNLGLKTGLNSTWNHGIMNNRIPIHGTRSERRPAGSGPRLAEFNHQRQAPCLLTFPLFNPDEQEAGLVMQAWLMLPVDMGGSRAGGWVSGGRM